MSTLERIEARTEVRLCKFWTAVYNCQTDIVTAMLITNPELATYAYPTGKTFLDVAMVVSKEQELEIEEMQPVFPAIRHILVVTSLVNAGVVHGNYTFDISQLLKRLEERTQVLLADEQ